MDDIGPEGQDHTPEAYDVVDGIDVPCHLDVLPDGRETLVIGDVKGLSAFTHRQGDNILGFGGTCGLCSCQDLLCQFGLRLSEDDIVLHATLNDQCYVSPVASESGGTTVSDQVEILRDYGVPANFEIAESLEDLAADIEQDRGVILEVNAGVIWDNALYYGAGEMNHAVVATGVSRDPETGDIQGFYINDTGTGTSGQFIDADTMRRGWLDAGGVSVVTDVARPEPGAPRDGGPDQVIGANDE